MKGEEISKEKSLTIVIPALNEEKKIALTVEKILSKARENLEKFEIIIIDDGSTDNSPKIISKLCKDNEEVKSFRNETPQGNATAFRIALEKSSCQFILGLPAYDVITTNSLVSLFQNVGEADIIIGQRKNQNKTRTKFRYILSKAFTLTSNLLFRLSLEDYNGPSISTVEKDRKFNLRSNRNCLGAEIIIRSLRDFKLSYVVIDVEMNVDKKILSSATRLVTLMDVLKTYFYLLFTKKNN